MKKKILLVTRPIAPPWDEASKNFAFDLGKKISSCEDLELHLLTNGEVSELPKNVVQEKIYTSSQNDFGLSQKIRLGKFLLFNARKFDVIHLLFTPTKANILLMKICLAFSKSKTMQTVATLREDIFSDETIKKLMFADLVITYSDYAKNKLKTLGIKNVERIYPGIDLEKYKFREKNVELLGKIGFSMENFLIHFSGEYVRLGAMNDVIESFIRISERMPEARLLMAVRVKNEKDAQKKRQVVAKLKETGLLEKTAFFDDGKHKMEDIYNLADVSLFPVRNMHGKFDVPLVVVEAMACEKPVIVSDIPILEEFTDQKNSVKIPKGDVSALTEAIIDFHSNSEKGAILGKQARAYVEQNFDIKNVSGQYAEIYNSII